jgi:hypothetical protein
MTQGGLRFLRYFVSVYAAIAIAMTAGFDAWRTASTAERLQFTAAIALFLLYTIAGGPRSGVITLLIVALVHTLHRKGDLQLA